MLNKVMIIVLAFMISGCSLDPDIQEALNNYAKANCNGKLLEVQHLTMDGTLDSDMSFRCVTDKGVETYRVVIKNIPVKYWEIPDAPEE